MNTKTLMAALLVATASLMVAPTATADHDLNCPDDAALPFPVGAFPGALGNEEDIIRLQVVIPGGTGNRDITLTSIAPTVPDPTIGAAEFRVLEDQGEDKCHLYRDFSDSDATLLGSSTSSKTYYIEVRASEDFDVPVAFVLTNIPAM